MNFIKKYFLKRLLSKIYLLAKDLSSDYGYANEAYTIKEIIQKIRRDNHL